jgi:HD-like signal output (HDOD) protein
MDTGGAKKGESAEGHAAPWCVLFVGGDPLWFGQIQRDVACLHPGWLCLHAADIVGAFKMLAAGTVEGMVVDGKTADSRRLLDAVRAEQPDMICLIRSDMSDRKAGESWKGVDVPLMDSHKDASALVAGLLRSVRLREWTSDPAIKTILPQIRKLPATPRLYDEVTKELRNPHGSLEVVARLIQQDPVMSAKLLQLVNSAFFASAHEITNMLDAVMILGTERINSLILLAGIFSQYGNSGDFAAAVQGILAHSVQVGAFSRVIALRETRNAMTAEAAFTAGVLHDVGKLILAGNLPAQFDRVKKLKSAEKMPDRAAELQIYGVSHSKLGGCLLAAWGLPLPILEAIAYHHEPEESSSKNFSLLAAVYAANFFAHEKGLPSPNPDLGDEKLQYLDRVGLGDRRDRWRDLCDDGAGG